MAEYGGGALLRIAGSVTAAGLEMTFDDGVPTGKAYLHGGEAGARGWAF